MLVIATHQLTSRHIWYINILTWYNILLIVTSPVNINTEYPPIPPALPFHHDPMIKSALNWKSFNILFKFSWWWRGSLSASTCWWSLPGSLTSWHFWRSQLHQRPSPVHRTKSSSLSILEVKLNLKFFFRVKGLIFCNSAQRNRMRKLFVNVSWQELYLRSISPVCNQQLNPVLINFLQISCKNCAVRFFSTRGELSRWV